VELHHQAARCAVVELELITGRRLRQLESSPTLKRRSILRRLPLLLP
jgi:hypothetical protein